MTTEVKKAKLNVDFKAGFTISPDLSIEEVLIAVLQGLKNGNAENIDIAVQYCNEEDLIDEP